MVQQTTQMNATAETLPDLSSALSLAESRSIIEYIFRDFCGLITHTEADKTIYKRITRPHITYESAKELESFIFRNVNRITARTHFDPSHISDIMLIISEDLSNWMSIVGMPQLISPKVWEICLELNKPDPETYVENENKEIEYLTYWQSKYKITWKYEDPFTHEMLNIIKRDYDLEKETFGQDVIMKQIWSTVLVFIEGGINRSRDHLTLDHEKVIHKETYGQKTEALNGTNESKIDGLKRGISKLFGG